MIKHERLFKDETNNREFVVFNVTDLQMNYGK